MPELYVALMHYPVVNKNGGIIASAVTNLDLHDIARAAKTYGVKSFFSLFTTIAVQKIILRKYIYQFLNLTKVPLRTIHAISDFSVCIKLRIEASASTSALSGLLLFFLLNKVLFSNFQKESYVALSGSKTDSDWCSFEMTVMRMLSSSKKSFGSMKVKAVS